MKIISKVDLLKQAVREAREKQLSVGLVPTMGALHEGHKSLVERARRENDVVVVSVFLNPTQFNNADDLRTYPRTAEADAALLEACGVDIAFMPSVEDIYPEPDTRVFHLGPVAEVMEGAMRPGHFNGVCQIVSKLFMMVEPDRAYFGEKDFQQIAIIRNLLQQIQYPIELVACPIVRADDGLALSSRNMRLSPAARAMAPAIYDTLQHAVEMSDYEDVEDVIEWVLGTLASYHEVNPQPDNLRFEPEYFEIVDDTTLQPVQSWDDAKGIVGCITVWLDGVRLIDMVRFR